MKRLLINVVPPLVVFVVLVLLAEGIIAAAHDAFEAAVGGAQQ